MGSSKSSKTTESIVIRFTPYIESYHSTVLGITAGVRASIITNSPYEDYVDQDVESAVFGIGYAISNFPSLYDMYGKFMAGLDIDEMYLNLFGGLFSKSEINESVVEDMVAYDDKNVVDETLAAKLRARELNATATSTFIVSLAMIESRRLKVLEEISMFKKSIILRNALVERDNELDWNKDVVDEYVSIMHLYYMTTINGDDANYTFKAKNSLWPLEVLDFERAMIAALRGRAGSEKSLLRRRSNISKMLSVAFDTYIGKQIGGMIGGWQGAIIGAAIGTHVGIAKMLIEMERPDLVPISFLLPAPFGLMYR